MVMMVAMGLGRCDAGEPLAQPCRQRDRTVAVLGGDRSCLLRPDLDRGVEVMTDQRRCSPNILNSSGFQRGQVTGHLRPPRYRCR